MSLFMFLVLNILIRPFASLRHNYLTTASLIRRYDVTITSLLRQYDVITSLLCQCYVTRCRIRHFCVFMPHCVTKPALLRYDIINLFLVLVNNYIHICYIVSTIPIIGVLQSFAALNPDDTTNPDCTSGAQTPHSTESSTRHHPNVTCVVSCYGSS